MGGSKILRLDFTGARFVILLSVELLCKDSVDCLFLDYFFTFLPPDSGEDAGTTYFLRQIT